MKIVLFFHNLWKWIISKAIWLWPTTIFVMSITYSALFVNPFSSTEPGLEAADVASSWNASVSQLGISPLYPPQENFFVGDLWVIVTKAPNTGILGRGVRLAHIDLSEAITIEHRARDAVENMFEDSLATSAKLSDPVKKLKMFSLAFPGITVSTNKSDATGSSLPILSFGSSRRNNTFDEIKIPSAESYGASVVEAMLKLYNFCDDEKTKIVCTASFARNVLAANLDSDLSLSNVKNGTYEIRLQLITRVYMTKSISHRRVNIGEVTVDAKALTELLKQKTSDDKNEDKAAQQNLINRRGLNSSDLSFDEKFTTPLVFGFRSAIFVPR